MGASGNLFSREETKNGSMRRTQESALGDTMRALADSFKTNEAGEAFYDSEKGFGDKVTDSNRSLVASDLSPGKFSRRTGSKGRSRRSKRSHASIVLEEPSKEDKGFAF